MHGVLWRRDMLDVVFDPALALVGHVVEERVPPVVLRHGTSSVQQPGQKAFEGAYLERRVQGG